MTLNRELFTQDPLEGTIPNSGVAKVGRPDNDAEWSVLRHELSSFVCSGEYARGLDVILSSYLTQLHQPEQRAVWVSGFYGSGKSHLVRVLEHLWTDTPLPGGAHPRGLVISLPDDVREALKTLTAEATRGRTISWAASGSLGAGAVEQIEVAFCAILHRAAGLPTSLGAATCALWMHEEGIHDAVKSVVQAEGRSFEHELNNLYVSSSLAAAVLAAKPGLATSPAEMSKTLRAQFPDASPKTLDQLFTHVKGVLEHVSGTPGTIPLTLVVLDEVQQYINDDNQKALAVQDLVEMLTKRFSSRVLVVATGQSELTARAALFKLTDRFRVEVHLRNQDVDAVVRQVVLRKTQAGAAELEQKLGSTVGEISRQLGGSKIAHRGDDRDVWVEDYPLLPTRRRFWEGVLREADQDGRAGQLRSQLRVVHEASRRVADEPVGSVVGGDYLYEDKSADLLSSGRLLPELVRLIDIERAAGGHGELRARVLATVFLISLLPTEGPNTIGVTSSAEHVADLLITDLASSGAELRHRVPLVLDDLVVDGKLQRTGSVYRLQTTEGQEWTKEFDALRAGVMADVDVLAAERTTVLRAALAKIVPTVRQGTTKTARTVVLDHGDVQPVEGDDLTVWVRTGWDVSRAEFDQTVKALGQDSAIVAVHVPRPDDDALVNALADRLAATRTLGRSEPTTPGGKHAKQSMQSVQAAAATTVSELVEELLSRAAVLQAGGSTVEGASLRDRLQSAAERSARRLFPRFSEADNTGWETALTRAREGNPEALSAVGHHGDVTQNPVVREVLSSLSASPTSGAVIESRFTSAPFGWPRPAVRGALLVLVVNELVAAQINGQAATAKSIPSTGVGKATFHTGIVHSSPETKIKARVLLQQLGEKVAAGDEAVAAGRALARLRTRAADVSGAPPLPQVSLSPAVVELGSLDGNALVNGFVSASVALLADHARLETAHTRSGPRLEALRTAAALAEHARSGGVAQAACAELDAIRVGRSLLDDVDPVEPVLLGLAEELRTALTSRHEDVLHAVTTARSQLDDDPSWTVLDDPTRSELLTRHGLVPPPQLSVGTPTDVLRELRSTSLGAWVERAAAVVSRRQQAAAEALQLAQPAAVRVHVPHATVASASELEAYLSTVREHLTTQLAAHGTIAI